MESRWRSGINKIASIKAVTASKQKSSEDEAKLLESAEHEHQGGKEEEESEANARETETLQFKK